MAIDKRLTEIKEGAGLDESRVNVEFVDFLRKWSTPVLLILAVFAVGWFLYTRQQQAKVERQAEAFRQFTIVASSSNPSPASLIGIAETYGDVKGIGPMARLAAADEYMRAVRRNVRPGSELGPAGTVLDPGDELAAEERSRLLDEAERLYRRVHADTRDNPAMTLHTLGALYGLAAVAESVGDLDAARNVLDQAALLAEQRGFVQHVLLARERLALLNDRPEAPRLYRASDLAPLPDLPRLDDPDFGMLLEDEIGPFLPESDDAADGPDADEQPDEPAQPDGPDDGAGSDDDGR